MAAAYVICVSQSGVGNCFIHIRQLLNIRDGTSVLLFSDGSTLLRSELDSLIKLSNYSCLVVVLTA